MHANESGHGCTEAVHPSGGPANTGSALNIHVYLRSSAADCFFQDINNFTPVLIARPIEMRSDKRMMQTRESPPAAIEIVNQCNSNAYSLQQTFPLIHSRGRQDQILSVYVRIPSARPTLSPG